MVVDLPCFSVVRSLTSWYAFLLLFFVRYASTSWHCTCIQVSFAIFISVLIFKAFNLSTVFGSFWLASLFLQVSSLVTKIKDLRGNPGLPLPAWVTMESRSASSSSSVARGENPGARRCEGCRICHYLSWTDSIKPSLLFSNFGCCISKGSLFRLFTMLHKDIIILFDFLPSVTFHLPSKEREFLPGHCIYFIIPGCYTSLTELQYKHYMYTRWTKSGSWAIISYSW